jgi:hypothetical protein
MAMAAAPAADAVAGRVAAQQASKTAAKDAAATAATSGGGGGKGGGKGSQGGGKGQGQGSGQGGGKSGGGKAQSSRGKRAVSWAWSGSKKLLMAEFILCVVVLALGSLTSDPEDGKDQAARAMVKASAFALIFFLLAILSAGGKGAAKSATAVGTLITVSYTLTSADVHAVVTWINSFFKGAGKKFPAPEKSEKESS